MYAQMILFDRPTIDSVGGLVVKNKKGDVVQIHVSSRLLQEFGTRGLTRGIKNDDGEVRLSEERFEGKNPDAVLKSIKEIKQKFGLDIQFDPAQLRE